MIRYLLLPALLISQTLCGQINPNVIWLNNDFTGSQQFIAKQAIYMLPGFSYSAGSSGDSFLGKTETCSIPSIEYYTGAGIPDPENRILDLNNVVGTTTGISSVNDLGGFIYQIPVYTAPGTKGIQPSISINYNSKSGNGILGLGWNLGGISTIARIPRPFYINENIQPIKMVPEDEYALDGNRLVLINGSGTHGSDGSQYRTEIETFTKTSMYGISGGGPTWLKTFNEKDGSSIEFGNGENAFIENAQGTRLIWFITRYEDVHGNYILYNYSKDPSSNQVFLSSIQYTGNMNTGLLPFNELQFEYRRRTDKSNHYQGGIEIPNELLINKIYSLCEGTLIRVYEFYYTLDEFSKLVNLKEATGMVSYNSTIFKYGNENPTSTLLSPLTKTGQHYQYFADFNGDGRNDFILIPKKPGEQYSFSDSIEFYQNLDGVSFALKNKLPFSPFEPDNGGQIKYTEYTPEPYVCNIVDINGDGKHDFYTFMQIYYDNDHDPLQLADTWGNFFIYYTVDCQTGKLKYQNHDQLSVGTTTIPGDFNGDGITDRLVIMPGDQIYRLHYGTSSFATYSLPVSFLNREFTDKVSAADFNGDGKSDLLLIDEGYLYVYEFTGSGFSELMTPTQFPSTEFTLGDVNGDGKVDILGYDNGIILLYSTGFGFLNADFQPQYTSTYSDLDYHLYDIDGDGRAEIIQVNTNIEVWGFITIYKKYYYAYQYENDSFIAEEIYYDQSGVGNSVSEFSDFDGDGQAELYFRPLYDFETQYSYIRRYRPDNKTKLLTNIADGLNNRYAITYEAMPKSQSYNTTGDPPVYPLLRPCLPIYLTVNAKKFNQGETTPIENLGYNYANLLIHQRGRGFLGFNMRTIYDAVSHNKKELEYSFGSTFFNVFLAKEKNYTNSILTSEVSNSQPAIHTFENNRYFSYLSNSTIENKLNGNKVESVTLINSSGNLTSKSAIYKNSTDQIAKSEVEEYSDHNDFGSPQSAVKTITKQSESIIRSQAFEYFPITNRIKKAVNIYSGSPSVEFSYTYDSFGNILTETKSWNGQSRTITKSYEATKGRFIVSETNPLNQTTSFTRDEATGNILSFTDHLGLTTTYEYDEFGNLISTLYQGGHAINLNRVWSLGTEAIGETYFELTQGLNSPSQKIYFDSSGRKLREKAQVQDGTFSITDISYDTYGRLYREYSQYLEGASPLRYIEYGYDNLNRVTSITRFPGNFAESITYYDSENKVRTSRGGVDTYREYDALGLLWRATDPGGSIVYTYNPEDQPIQISSPSGTTYFEYDTYGNQKKLIDLDAGTINYIYDGLGQLTEQTDQRGNTVTIDYDVIGRVLQKSWTAGETINYSYNQITGLIDGVSTPTYSRAYTYDSMFRVAQVTETFDGVQYSRGYQYNNKGEVTTSTINNSVVVENIFNSLGFIVGIKVNNQDVWGAENMNPHGIIDEFILGNQTSTQMSFDDYGFLESITTTRNENYIQNWIYGFDPNTGNLVSREGLSSAGGSITETFSYDLLNRLLSSNIGQSSISISYDQGGIGNIVTKSDVGNYDYTGGLHQVQNIYNPSILVQSLPQSAIEYNKFNKVSKIVETDQQSTKRELQIVYSAEEERIKSSFLVDDQVGYSKHFAFGIYEKEFNTSGTIRELFYIDSPVGLVAILQRKNNLDTLFYIHTDHLGSYDVITGPDGAIKERLSFDPWGRRRNPGNWSYDNIPPVTFDRGFTGHEHLDEFHLINMNGRVFDPVMGLFLSPDKYIQAPELTHGFNRYSYCLNNPLIYTDPSGEFIFTAVCLLVPGLQPLLPIAIGADIGAVTGGIRGANDPDVGFWKGAGRGALVGGVGGALSMVGGGTFVANVAWGMGQGAVTGGLDAALWGNDIGQGMLYGGAIGGAFAFGQSSYQSIKNYKDYGMFGTNDGVFNRMVNDAFTGNTTSGAYTIDPVKAKDALDFWQARNGGPSLSFGAGQSNGTTDKLGNIKVGEGAFVGGHRAVREQISHEMGHYINNVNWDKGVVGGKVSNPKFINLNKQYGGDGIYGYHGAIEGAGKYHTGLKMISNNTYYRPKTLWHITNPHWSTAWQSYGWQKWFYLIPHRF